MKTIILLLFLIAFATFAYGQKVEFAGQLNAGFSKFGGESAVRTTVMNYYTFDNSWNRIANPYGSRIAFSYGASLQVQRVTGNNILIGAQAGAEVLRSRVNIDKVYVSEAIYSSYMERKEATGKSIIRNEFINLYPYLGYRIHKGAVDFDINLGPEIGICLSSREKGEATAEDGTEYKVKQKGTDHKADMRGRVGITAYYNHFGLSASYAHGLTNYFRGYDGGNPELYSRVIRLGLLYRL